MREKGMIDFREKIPERKLTVFLLPLILSGLFQQIYAPVSTAVAGRYLSQQAVAVIGACSACKSLEGFLFVSMTTGFSFFINHQLGTDNQAKYKEAFQGALLLAGLFSVFGIFLALAVDPVMLLVGTGSLTLGVLVCSYPLLCVRMICRNGLQSIGCYRDLLLFGMTELLMNLFLALLLIPNLGFGAACFRTAFIWGIPGLIAGLVYRKRVGSEAYF